MQRIILVMLSTLVAVGTVFAFGNYNSKKTIGTLFTKSNGVFNLVPCKVTGYTPCNPTHGITYYTANFRSALPKRQTVFVTE